MKEQKRITDLIVDFAQSNQSENAKFALETGIDSWIEECSECESDCSLDRCSKRKEGF